MKRYLGACSNRPMMKFTGRRRRRRASCYKDDQSHWESIDKRQVTVNVIMLLPCHSVRFLLPGAAKK